MIKTKITICRFDKDHRLLEKREQPSRSWLRHFFELLYEPLGFQINTLAAISDIAGAPRTLRAVNGSAYPNLSVWSSPGGTNRPLENSNNAAPAVTSYSVPVLGDSVGIQVGSNATAVTPTDNSLNTKIAHGEVGGTLLYGGTELYGLLFVNPNGEFTIRRYYTNKSGGNVTVREVGIYSPGDNAANTAYIFCIARDLTLVMGVPTDVVVLNTEILEVEYTVQITV